MDSSNDAMFLFISEWKDRVSDLQQGKPGKSHADAESSVREAKSIAESLRAIHDVLEVARQFDGAAVNILCSTLSMLLRESAWRKHTGSTFADQLLQALKHDAKVHILVFGDADSIYPVAPSMLALLGQYGNGPDPQLRIVMTGMDERTKTFFRGFPHFTMTTVGTSPNADSFVHVEWEHPSGPVDWMNGDALFSGLAFAAKKEDKNEVQNFLSKRFENLFKFYAKAADSHNHNVTS